MMQRAGACAKCGADTNMTGLTKSILTFLRMNGKSGRDSNVYCENGHSGADEVIWGNEIEEEESGWLNDAVETRDAEAIVIRIAELVSTLRAVFGMEEEEIAEAIAIAEAARR